MRPPIAAAGFALVLAMAGGAGAAEGPRTLVTIPADEIPWWIDQADWELAAAERALGIEAPAVAVVLAQQAVEKHLKVRYVLDGLGAPPRSHNLGVLGRAVGLPPDMVRDGERLGRDSIRCRYPDAARGVPHLVCDRALAEDRLRRARRIIEYLRRADGRPRATPRGLSRRSGPGSRPRRRPAIIGG